MAFVWEVRPARRSLTHWPTIMTGLSSMKAAKAQECSTLTMTRPRTSGITALSNCRRTLSPRFGSAGTSIRRGRPEGISRGGRL